MLAPAMDGEGQYCCGQVEQALAASAEPDIAATKPEEQVETSKQLAMGVAHCPPEASDWTRHVHGEEAKWGGSEQATDDIYDQLLDVLNSKSFVCEMQDVLAQKNSSNTTQIHIASSVEDHLRRRDEGWYRLLGSDHQFS